MTTPPFGPVRFADRDATLLGGLRRHHVVAHAPAGMAAPCFELYPDGADPLSAPDGVEIWVGVVPRRAA